MENSLITKIEKFKNRLVKAKEIFKISEIDKSTAYEFVRRYHYLGNAKFFSNHSFGLFIDNSLVGVSNFSTPEGNKTLESWFNLPCNDQSVLELSRLAMLPLLNGSNATSFLLGGSLQKLKKKGIRAIISLSTSDRHVGSIYQICNFKYFGLTNEKSDFYLEDGTIQNRGKTKNLRGVWVRRSRKHRYAYIIDKNLKCNYEEKPFPKKGELEKLICCNNTGKVFDNRFGVWYKCPVCNKKNKKEDVGLLDFLKI